ncbi:hypothetical protein FE840_000360 [Peteryoungia desertarenae]|uniref:Uncharacterized protein n=1 Tax=Peteryoungia desertarenae TaxID=1813451 RepID=A0ABX6QHT5_9HYPH|nr:hypothetical protein [Peteryoungia desertarenae]QLF68064.1 hypothetical protein FE840_000360 [Peteryoungia desertarenae]
MNIARNVSLIAAYGAICFDHSLHPPCNRINIRGMAFDFIDLSRQKLGNHCIPCNKTAGRGVVLAAGKIGLTGDSWLSQEAQTADGVLDRPRDKKEGNNR